jgi:hypothetical protein
MVTANEKQSHLVQHELRGPGTLLKQSQKVSWVFSVLSTEASWFLEFSQPLGLSGMNHKTKILAQSS